MPYPLTLRALFAAIACTTAVLLAGCSSGDDRTSSSMPSSTKGSQQPTAEPAPTTTVSVATTEPEPVATIPMPTDDEADAITQTIEDTWAALAATPLPATMVPGPPRIASAIPGDDPVRGHLLVREPVVKHQIAMGPETAYEMSAHDCTHSRRPSGEIVTRLWEIKLHGEGDAWVVDRMSVFMEWEGETTCTNF